MAHDWQRTLEAFRERRARLLRVRGVVGADVGVRIVRGRPTTSPVIRVHVRPPAKGRRRRPAGLPKKIAGVPVVVLWRTWFVPSEDCPSDWPSGHHKTLIGGVAIGRAVTVNLGTLGACVTDAAGTKYALTCHHVVHDAHGNAEAVVQPPGSAQVIGTVEKATLDEHLDAAIVKLNGSRGVKSGVRTGSIGGILDPVPADRLPLPVKVVGGCSGITDGFVVGLDFEDDIPAPGGAIHFTGHLLLHGDGMDVSRGGDSGGLVLERGTRRVVGMIRAGEPPGVADYGVATPIARILAAMGVTFL